ncbi:MAG: thioesterase family protein [Spirochaetes bacterium]|nr:thioesterase family protein [Spirochaetota bacterium]
MPRLQLNELSVYSFRYHYKININDINIWGHVGIPEMIAIIHLARRDMLCSIGFDENNMGDNTVLIIADVAMNLLKELHLDDEIIIDTTIGEIGNKSFRFFHKISHNDATAVLVEMGAVILDKLTRKPVRISSKFLNKILPYTDTIFQKNLR